MRLGSVLPFSQRLMESGVVPSAPANCSWFILAAKRMALIKSFIIYLPIICCHILLYTMIGGLSRDCNYFIYKRLAEIRTVSLRFCLNCRTSFLLRQSLQGYRQVERICLPKARFRQLTACKRWRWRALLSHSSIRASSFLMILMLSISWGLMHRAEWMLGRRIE